ncbi:hypothetical protein BGZ75_001077 [Mortierella antarctica]|nr:hypothetical protein BGZ75_001077 [Mortierella antarctica]
MGGGNDSNVSSINNQGTEGDFIVRALHEYHTDSVGHLSFAQFQYIKVIHCEESGWWLGESESNRGWFPSNRVERVDPVYETEITSEDYDQIRTGLDGVETQFLGEPLSESITDSAHLDWTVKPTRAGQLAFPPSQLSVPQPYYGPESSSTDMENDMFYHHTISSTTSLNNSDISYAYSDFVAEVTLYVDELKDSISKGDVDRYQPVVANIISCVKALLVFTNTIARESEVLQTYPELARSRRVILRALGKLYSKCRVANGSQALTTTRQRQYAVEKLGIFAGQVLGGIADFATRACEIGLRIRAEHSPMPAAGAGELDMVLMASGEVDTASISGTALSTTSSSYGRPRRRVSRANSAKGFKSFNAVRQWKSEHVQKHNAARNAIEFLLEEYMECLNGSKGSTALNDILKKTIQAGQVVEKFLMSAEEMKTRTNIKEDTDYTTNKALLLTTMTDLFGFIHTLESAPEGRNHAVDAILNRFMSLVSVMLRCLVDMEVIPKASTSSQSVQETSLFSGNRRISFPQDQESQTLEALSASRSITPEPRIEDDIYENGRSYQLSDSPVSSAVGSNTDNLSRATYLSKNTTSVRPKQQTNSFGQVVPLNRKLISMTSMNEKYKRQANSGQYSLDKDVPGTHPETAVYGEAHDLESDQMDFYRSPHHDSAVVLSTKNTPHHSLMNGNKASSPRIPVVEDSEERKSTTGLRRQNRKSDQGQGGEKGSKTEKSHGELDDAIKEAERKIAAIFMPTMGRVQISQEIIAPTVAVLQTDPSPQNTAENDVMAPPTPNLRPHFTAETRPSNTASRASRATKSTAESAGATTSRTSGARQAAAGRNAARRPSTEIDGSNEDSDIVGLGVSTPSGTHPKHASSSTISSQVSASSTSAPRAPGNVRASGRNVTSPSPRLESSRRVPRSSETSVHPHSPNLSAQSTNSRAGSRMGGSASSSLSPATIMPGSRRGSEHSARSEASARRKSNDNQSLRENDPRCDYQDRRQPSSQAGPRRASKASMSTTPSPRMGPFNTREEDMTSGSSTPASSHIHSFQDGRQSPRRPIKSNRRESVQSNLSVATESSVHSRSSNLRPVSPALRGRHHNSPDSSIKGRLSSESNISSNDKQHYHHQQQPQPTRGTPSSSAYRPRPNRVGQAKIRTGSEDKLEATPVPATNPWFLENDYESDEVLYNDNGILVAATLDAYIEMLTSHKNTPDAAFVSTFFITFRLFTSPVELVDLLVKRFMKTPPAELSEFEQLMWAQQKQERIQKRVHIALRTWLETYWVTDKDRDAFKSIMEFVAHEMMEALPGPAGRLLDMLNQWANKRRSLGLNSRTQIISKARSHDRIDQTDSALDAHNNSSHGSKLFATVKDRSLGDQLKNSGRKGIGNAFGGSSGDGPQARGPPVPLVNKALLNALSSDHNLSKVPVTDIKPVELARQLTIMFGRLYADIPYLELLEKDRPNCSRMAQISNKIIIWVTDTIVDEQDVKKRIGVVKHWIEVGEECLRLNNYDTLFAISSAIESTPVKRLYNTWEGINKAYYDRSTQLRKIVSNELNYSVYRARLKTVQAPCIPFLGIYLTTITYIEDGNSTYKDPNPMPTPGVPSQSTDNTSAPSTRKLLRYGRFYQLAKAVQELRGFQGSYELLEVPRLRDYILKCIENQDSERSYRKSLAIEPRRPAPNHIPATPGMSGHGTSGGQRSSGGGKGLFHGGITNSDVNSNVPTKLNKLSFFRKSARSDRS